VNVDAGAARAERWAGYAPLAIVIYFAVQLAVRLSLSPNLEVDDAEMVGQIDWAWGYANSHAPLYHWLVRLCHDLFGNWVAATSVPKYVLLAAGYLLVFDAGRRGTGSALTGALAAATLLFIPVIAWKTQGKLTHSILGFTATAATLHAAVMIVRRGGVWAFVWLGVAAAIGVLAKYNYLLVLVAVAVAVVCVRDVRRAFARPAVSLAAAVALVLIAPHLLWVRANPELATERVYMLQTGGGPLGLNLPANTVADGLLSLLLVVLISVVPAAAVWAIAAALASKDAPRAEYKDGSVRRFVDCLVAAELVVFIATVAIAGFTQVHERYLVVLLPPIGLWFALTFRRRSASFILGTAAAVAFVITIARPLSVLRGTGRLMFPYDAVAQDAATLAPPPFAVLGDRPENAANIVIRLPSASMFDARAPADRVIIAADTPARVAELAQRLGSSYAPMADIRVVRHRFPLHEERKAELALQPFARASVGEP
jgi:4-amino-4-deoxy-L-arabinose transferase-like glycosyltransferase